jgi:hypothetical protein
MRMKPITVLLVLGVGVGAGCFSLNIQNGPDAQVPMQPLRPLSPMEKLCTLKLCSLARRQPEGSVVIATPSTDGRPPAPPHTTDTRGNHGDGPLFDYTKLSGQAAMAAQGLEFDSAMPVWRHHWMTKSGTLSPIRKSTYDRVQEMQQSRTEGE